jgi:hypothetical protein
MNLASLLSQLWRSYKAHTSTSLLGLNLESQASEVGARTITVDRPLSEQENAIAKWLLLNATPPAYAFLAQLDGARVAGLCGCGCPTVDLKLLEGTPRAEPRDNPIGDAIGEVNGKMVGVMLLQSDGYLRCLEVYDLSDIARPYGLPDFDSLRPFETTSPSTSASGYSGTID